MHKNKLICILCSLVVMIFILAGCGGKQDEPPPVDTVVDTPIISPAVQTNPVAQFLTIGLKVKTDVTYSNASSNEKVILELFVDGNGNGEGLIGFGDTVLNVLANDGKLYIVLDNTAVIYVTDINARGYFSSITGTSIAELEGAGFGFTEDFPSSFNGSQNGVILHTVYASSNNVYRAKRVSEDNAMTLAEAKPYALEYLGLVVADGATSTEPDKVVTSFYTDDKYGVTIDGIRYSLGDTCNPDDYFANLIPEGFMYSTEYKEDTKLTLTHVSYISTSGRTSFSLLDNYVQAIQTIGDFNFRGFTRGMTAKEVKYALAYKLSTKETDVYKAFDEDIVVDTFKGNVYYCHVGDISIEFRLNNAGLNEIYITKPLGFW